MTIDIKPETERLVREELQRGHFLSVDEIIVEGVQARRERQPQLGPGTGHRPPGRKSLAQLFAESPFKGLSLDFERDPDTGRSIEL
ncbi:MAG TPA: hypothetical protein VNY05_06515 [Candidatus Acidoferrales bacterium]|jgi:hypothetical protein|nr:hypothetical protein [Candidatus Acidoferrales bacterium]